MALRGVRNTLGAILSNRPQIDDEDSSRSPSCNYKSSGSAVTVGLVAAVGGFLYGYDTGLINDIMEMQYVKSEIPANGVNFTVHERALITAILSLGTFFGALVAPLVSDSYGRRFSIITTAAFVFNAGTMLQVSATCVTLLCVGRAVSGVAVGILSAIVPLYQAEASPKWVRGSIVFTYQWAITWGLLIALAICQGTRKIYSSASYRIPIGIQFLWSIFLCVGMFYLPESPRYYVQKNDLQKALVSLHKLRCLSTDDPDLIEELVEIKANYDYEMSFGKVTYLDCFRLAGGRHKQGLRMITGIGIQTFQQCSGINFIFYYGVNFFASTGVQNYYIISFVTYLVNVIFTVPGIYFIDIIGRRQLLLLGGIGMSVSNFTIAIVGVTMTSIEAKSVVSILFSCIFIACFASSWGGCAWAICSDIYGISIRQKAVSITAATNWLINFVFAYITPYLIHTVSHTAALGNKIFFIWGSLNFAGLVFVYFMVYETKGLRLEEVDLMYQECCNSRLSTKFKSKRFDMSNVANEGGIHSLVNTPPNEWTLEYLNHDKDASNISSSPGADQRMAPGLELKKTDFSHEYSSRTEQDHVATDPIGLEYTMNFVSRDFSDTTSDSSGSVTGISNDYQRYLRDLQADTVGGSRQPLTSFTSTSIARGPGSMQKTGRKGRKSDPYSGASGMNTTSRSESYMSAKNLLSEPLDLQVNSNGNMKIIAAPFYTEPPSDSDSDTEPSTNID